MTLPGALYESLFAAYPDALLLVDRHGTIVLANPAANRLLGYTQAELNGLPVDALVPDAVRPQHAAYRAAYSHAPRARPMGTTQTELVAKHKDGHEVLVEIALSPLEGQDLPYVVAAIRGVADYPRVEQAVRRARYAELLAQLSRSAVDARDPSALVQAVPALAAQALQVPQAAVLLWDAGPQRMRLAASVGWAQGDASGAAFVLPPDAPAQQVLARNQSVVIDDIDTDTRFHIPAALAGSFRSAVMAPISALGSPAGVLVVRSPLRRRFGDDERRFVESLANLLATSLQRAQNEAALNHAQRMESVGQLTGGIAHDFNNLLTVIQGNLQVIEELPQLADAPAKAMVEAAMRAAKRAGDLTGKLLTFSRRQALQAQRVDVAPLLDTLADMLRRTLDRRIRVDVQVAPGCPPLHADPSQLEAALLNIAINARDAMPEGGLLAFLVAPEAWPASDAPTANAASCVRIAVSDSGSGMSEAVRQRAFEPFFTTKEAGRGTGLGLSTVYGFVKQSRGTLQLDSAPGMGTTVTMRLPQWQDAQHAAPTAAALVGRPAALPPGLRVWLVEDEPAVRQVMQTFLETLGCNVSLFGTAEDVLSHIAADARAAGTTAPADVLLTDIALGSGQRGTVLARQLSQRWPQLAVLLMSGYSQEMIDPGRGESWPWELLHKPCSREALAAALARALRPGGAPAS